MEEEIKIKFTHDSINDRSGNVLFVSNKETRFSPKKETLYNEQSLSFRLKPPVTKGRKSTFSSRLTSRIKQGLKGGVGSFSRNITSSDSGKSSDEVQRGVGNVALAAGRKTAAVAAKVTATAAKKAADTATTSSLLVGNAVVKAGTAATTGGVSIGCGCGLAIAIVLSIVIVLLMNICFNSCSAVNNISSEMENMIAAREGVFLDTLKEEKTTAEESGNYETVTVENANSVRVNRSDIKSWVFAKYNQISINSEIKELFNNTVFPALFSYSKEEYKDENGKLCLKIVVEKKEFVDILETVDLGLTDQQKQGLKRQFEYSSMINGGILSYPLVENTAVSDNYGMRIDPFTGEKSMHHGIDFPATEGTKIGAAANGNVVFAEDNGDLGLTVKIEHVDGMQTVYAHMSKIDVKAGDYIKRGDYIGEVGNTGKSTGAHLHFAVIIENEYVDPNIFIYKFKE